MVRLYFLFIDEPLCHGRVLLKSCEATYELSSCCQPTKRRGVSDDSQPYAVVAGHATQRKSFFSGHFQMPALMLLHCRCLRLRSSAGAIALHFYVIGQLCADCASFFLLSSRRFSFSAVDPTFPSIRDHTCSASPPFEASCIVFL